MMLHPSALNIQLLGYAAGATCTYCFVAKQDLQLRLAILFGEVLFASHYYLLGAMTAALLCSVTVGWQVLSMYSGRYPRRLRQVLVLTVCALYLGCGIATWEGFRSLVPLASSVLSALAMMALTGRPLRNVLLVCDALWLLNGVLNDSQGAMVFATLSLLINAWTLYHRRVTAAGSEGFPAPVSL